MHEAVSVEALQVVIGVVFRDPTILQRALTHSSYLNENPDCSWGDNERLEFLGDAVADFVAADLLFGRFPEWQEGELTSLRAEMVRADTLARFALKIELGAHLHLGRGEEQSGGRVRPALLSDAFEALLGAIYLEGGMPAAERFVLPFLLDFLKGRESLLQRDPKSRLQEWAQAKFRSTPVYVTVEEVGPDHARQFTIEVLIRGEPRGRGAGRSKQAAEQAAAQAAWESCPDLALPGV
jgi:ribonuclease-3